MQDFRKLVVWQKAHTLALDTYHATASFPVDERLGLTSQMRRAGSSVPMNIAEACGRGGQREFAQFLRIASGSVSEIEYQVILARDLKFVQAALAERLDASIQEIKRMLASLMRCASQSSRYSKLTTND